MSERPHFESNKHGVPGLLRRLGAILYDTLLVIGLMFMASTLVIIILGIISGLDNIDPAGLRNNPFYIAYLLSIPSLFYICFWKLAGQTLGMRTWRLRVVDEQGGKLSWRGATLRFVAAALSWAVLGLGYFWILIDPEKKAWHDRLSRTRLILTSKT